MAREGEQSGQQPRKRAVQIASSGAPWLPPPWEKADASALQALQAGQATPEQQKRALDWIIRQAAGTYDLAYRPGAEDGNRDTTFALGRQFVGQQIVKLLNLALGMIQNREPNADAAEPKY